MTITSSQVRNEQSASPTDQHYSTSKLATEHRVTIKQKQLSVQPEIQISKSVHEFVKDTSNNGRPVSRGSPKFQNTPFDASHPLPKLVLIWLFVYPNHTTKHPPTTATATHSHPHAPKPTNSPTHSINQNNQSN